MRRLVLAPFVASLVLAAHGPGPSAPLTPGLAAETVASLAALIEERYFDPMRAKRIVAVLRNELARGRYERVTSPHALASLINADLLSVSHDPHLAVIACADAAPGSLSSPVPRNVAGARDNFGVRRFEILAGNVGYLDFRAFWRPSEAAATLAAAMTALAHADAVILDLRENQGGSSDGLALVASYLLEMPGKPLFEMVPRPPASPTAFQAEAEPLPGRIGNRPLYFLTSAKTFSAGEGLAFLLQERGRAEVIGERTMGGANQTKNHRINDQFEARICNAEFRSVLTGKNWEGVGIRPDIEVAARDALAVAHERALHQMLKDAPPGPWRDALQAALTGLKAVHPVRNTPDR